ncbi:MAG TPA: hypothetical protein VHC49_21815 [Mycobacteriales bacterium]|nr:hypothetical protein [Mycobacteriales bacterium]
MVWPRRSRNRVPPCQICNKGEVNNGTKVGRKFVPKYFCNDCESRLLGGGRVDVPDRTLTKLCQELSAGIDTADCAARKLLLLRDPRSADALHAYLTKQQWPAREAGMALAAMDDPRADATMHDRLEMDPKYRVFARNQKTADDVIDGIVAVRIAAGRDQKLEILTLAGDPTQAISQIADILDFPPDHPVRTTGLSGIHSPGSGVTRFHSDSWNSNHRPEDAILRWCNSSQTEAGGAGRNWVASKFAGQNESRGDVFGTAILTGIDASSGRLRSVPLRTLEYDLSVAAYGMAAGSVRAWRKAHGL